MKPVSGAGLGLRRALLADLSNPPEGVLLPDFLEVAPENWIGVGGRLGRQFSIMSERFPIVAHGLSLSLGSTDALNTDLVRAVGRFLDTHRIPIYSEHLSYCSDEGHLYDLMPIPFTEEAVLHVARRICQVQEILGRKIAIENVSYYAAPASRLSELEFINAVLDESGCELLLDVNNVYVNAINHRYDAKAFIAGLQAHQIRYFHVAGHFDEAPDLKVDTHGAEVIEPVWDLLQYAYELHGAGPTLLERDFNLPSLPYLLKEVDTIRHIQSRARAVVEKRHQPEVA